MNADQLIEAIGKTVAASKPADEYCFLWVDWWGTCMTKSEWSSWVQAFAVLVALGLPFILKKREKLASLERALQFHGQLKLIIHNLSMQLDYFDGSVVYGKMHEVLDVIKDIKPIRYRPEFLTSLSGYDNMLSHRLLLVADGIEDVRQIIHDIFESGMHDDPVYLTEIASSLFNDQLERLINIERELADLSLAMNPKEVFEDMSFMDRLRFFKDRFFIFIKC